MLKFFVRLVIPPHLMPHVSTKVTLPRRPRHEVENSKNDVEFSSPRSQNCFVVSSCGKTIPIQSQWFGRGLRQDMSQSKPGLLLEASFKQLIDTRNFARLPFASDSSNDHLRLVVTGYRSKLKNIICVIERSSGGVSPDLRSCSALIC